MSKEVSFNIGDTVYVIPESGVYIPDGHYCEPSRARIDSFLIDEDGAFIMVAFDGYKSEKIFPYPASSWGVQLFLSKAEAEIVIRERRGMQDMQKRQNGGKHDTSLL